MTQQPSVTIGIPVLNEEAYIETVINGFLNTGYPNLIEILIADGGSTDKTREIIEQIAKVDTRVVLVNNPDKYQSFALNKMINQAKGDIFVRADAHSIYANDYIEQCVKTLVETDAKNVGGAQRYLAQNRIQSGISIAMKSFLGNGRAKYKDENFEGYADTVFLGCFWTKDLIAIGGFNEKQITSQDLELNLRLKENYGECVFISPDIKCYYFPRDSFLKLLKQYFNHGRGRLVTILFHTGKDEFRGFFPFFFMLGLILFIALDLIVETDLYSVRIIFFLAAILFLESIRVAFSSHKLFKSNIWHGNQNSPGILSNILFVMPAIFIMQIGHFSGFTFQLSRTLFNNGKSW